MILILLIGGGFVGSAIFNLIRSSKSNKHKNLLEIIAYLLIVIGGIGFFGSALSATGGLNWLPSSFEWPIGYTDNAAKTQDGFYVVPHTSSGRIQIYDTDLKFLRGWNVDAHGGTYKISISKENLINVYTARGNWHYLFNLQGDIISKEKYVSGSYSSFPDSNLSLNIPTNIFLLVFSHPFISWFFAVIGIATLIILDKIKKKNYLTKQST